MSIVFEEYAPEVGRRPSIAVGGRRGDYDKAVNNSVEILHNTFFMTADELMNFYNKLGIIRRDRARAGHC